MDLNSLKKALEKNRIEKLQNSNKPQMPSVPKLIQNLGGSVVRNVSSVAAGNSLRVPAQEATNRLDICKKCEFFNKNSERCGKCGCYMAVKTYLKAERCPVGKW